MSKANNDARRNIRSRHKTAQAGVAYRVITDEPVGFAVGFKPNVPDLEYDEWALESDDGSPDAKPYRNNQTGALVLSATPPDPNLYTQEGPDGEMFIWRSQEELAQTRLETESQASTSGWQIQLMVKNRPATEEEAKQGLPLFGAKWEQTEDAEHGVYLAELTAEDAYQLDQNGYLDRKEGEYHLTGEMP